MTGKIIYWVTLIAAIAVVAYVVAGCASPPDMSRREAIDITNLAKELQK